MADATQVLRAATESIWGSPPAGLSGLHGLHRPPSGPVTKMAYANFDAYGLAGVLYLLRETSAADDIDIATMARVCGAVAERTGGRLETWGFAAEAETVASVLPALTGARDAQSLQAVLDELIVFLDRIHAWIDASIPWADLDTLKPLQPGADGY